MKKVLDNFLNFIKSNLVFLLVLVGIYFVMNYELPYAIYAPGGAINMGSRVQGDNLNKEEGSISMTYVSMIKGSLPMLGLSYVIDDWDIVKKDEIATNDQTIDDVIEIDKIYMKETISNATKVAYDKAEINYNITSSKTIVTYVDYDCKNYLKYNDELISIDNYPIKDLQELQNYIRSKSKDDELEMKYKRDNQEYISRVKLTEDNGTLYIGLGIATLNEYESDYNISVKQKNSESGPSGGFITALEIYNKITNEDITHGKKIMGTGTIDLNGNVGIIGGVKYKLIGAVKNKADIFLCPKENYEEAMKVKEEKGYDIKIYSIQTFDEAIDILNSINA